MPVMQVKTRRFPSAIRNIRSTALLNKYDLDSYCVFMESGDFEYMQIPKNDIEFQLLDQIIRSSSKFLSVTKNLGVSIYRYYSPSKQYVVLTVFDTYFTITLTGGYSV